MSTRISTVPRGYSARELQAAAAALAAGRFWTPATSAVTADENPHKHDGEVSDEHPARQDAVTPLHGNDSDVLAAAAVSALAPLVRVRAANAGAGASTIALAIADAADAAGLRTRVLDAAAPAWSGLTGATATELGAAGGWRRGRRGTTILIDRVREPAQVPDEVPSPCQVDGVDLTVLDAGWSLRELATATGGWLTETPAVAEVLVTRPHLLALSQTEAALATLEGQLAADHVVVVVVGATRWSKRGFTTAGRRLREAHAHDAVVFTPLLSPKVLPSLGPCPLPKQLSNPSQRLLEQITTITGPLRANRT